MSEAGIVGTQTGSRDEEASRAAAIEKALQNFWGPLREIYEGDANLRDYHPHEEPALRKIVPQVVAQLPSNYDIETPLGVGGSGIVAIVQDTNLHAKRALKISRPSPGKEHLLARVLQSESENLQRLSHQNLIRIFAQGSIRHNDQDYPFYVMEYVEGVQDADKYLNNPGITQEQVFAICSGVLAGVEYLHQQNTIHMDIKPGNILVTPAGVPIISDLGFAKQLRVDNGHTLIGGTEGYIHPDAKQLITEAKSNPNRLRGESPRTALKRSWDYYSLGRTFLKFLEVLDRHNPRVLSPYAKRYLRLLACRLLDGHNGPNEGAAGISLPTFKEIKYESVSQARTDLDKLTGSYNLEARIPELNLYAQESIQVSTFSVTPFTKRVQALLGHPTVMRLGSFSQLGLLNLVYPTATHNRLEHSLGTYSVMCRYVLALYNDPLNPLFRQLMDESDLRAALLAALLHDVGQYPLAHDLEEADPCFKHEQIVEAILKEGGSLARILEAQWRVQPARVLAILQADPKGLRGTLKDRILHSLISGPLDADKIDYLMRDSRHLGLNYGQGIDFGRLLQCLTIVFKEDRAQGQTYAALGIHEKGKVPAEAIFFARYAMFGQVYWHHAYRAIKAMIHRMVWEMFASVADSPEKKFSLQQEFRRFIAPGTDVPGQQPLFSVEPAQSAVAADVCQILPKDLAVLQWIAARSGQTGRDFLQLLKERKIFKRVFVLSHDKAQDRKLWESVTGFYRENATRGDRKLRLQQALQERITTLVRAEARTEAVSAEARKAFLAAADARQALLLLDMPPKRKGSDTTLEYVLEDDRRRFKADEIQIGSLEESVVWKSLRDSFHESIGKVRLFCYPDHEDFVSSFLTRQEFEQLLGDTIRQLEE